MSNGGKRIKGSGGWPTFRICRHCVPQLLPKKQFVKSPSKRLFFLAVCQDHDLPPSPSHPHVPSPQRSPGAHLQHSSIKKWPTVFLVYQRSGSEVFYAFVWSCLHFQVTSIIAQRKVKTLTGLGSILWAFKSEQQARTQNFCVFHLFYQHSRSTPVVLRWRIK